MCICGHIQPQHAAKHLLYLFLFFSLIKYFIVKGILSVTMNFTPNTLYWYLVTIEIQEFNLVLLCTSYKLLLMVTMPVKCLKCNYNTYAVTTRLRKSSNRTLCFNFLQVQKTSELEALHLSLTNVHLSQLEHSKVNVQQEHKSALTKVQASLRETFAQESARLQAQYHLELDQIRKQNQEQQERLHELHKQNMSECFLVVQSVFFVHVCLWLYSTYVLLWAWVSHAHSLVACSVQSRTQ